jgi:hypothetical protein
MELRGMNSLPPGNRDAWMFVAAVSLSYLLEPQLLEMEIIALGREVAGWSERETRSRMQAVFVRAYSASEGEVIEWKGQQHHALYKLTNRKIIDLLKITRKEERHLKTIISEETKQQRDRERQKRRRRAGGALGRDEYIAQTRERKQYNRHQAKKLRAQGKSLRKIGEALSISHSQVRLLLARFEQ